MILTTGKVVDNVLLTTDKFVDNVILTTGKVVFHWYGNCS